MSSRFGTKTYSRSHKICQSSIQFEKVFSDKSNKPSAAKSTGILHKWGKTSFTSLRNSHLNGQKEIEEEVKRPKLEIEVDDDPFSFDTDFETRATKKQVLPISSSSNKKSSPSAPKPNKFFKSGNRTVMRTLQTPIHTYSKVVAIAKSPAAHSGKSDMKQLTMETFTTKLSPPLETKYSDTFYPTSPDNMLRPAAPVKTYGLSKKSEVCDRLQPTVEQTKQISTYFTRKTKEEEEQVEEKDEDDLMVQRTKKFFRTYSSRKSQDEALTNYVSHPDSKQTELLTYQNTGSQKSLLSFGDSDASNTSQDFHRDPLRLESDSEHSIQSPLVQSNVECFSEHSNQSKQEEMLSKADSALEISLSQPEIHTDNSEQTQTQIPSVSSEPPTKTAGSVFKTRRIFNSPKKVDKKSLYKHRPWQIEEDPQELELSKEVTQPSLADEFEDDFAEPCHPTELTRITTWPTRVGDEAVTSVKCSKKVKELYKVVRNVKQAHQCHESGETQEFNDDIEYLLDGLQSTIPLSMRCLSVLSLAGKCMAPAFRMHLRAHGTISKVFCALHDAPNDPNLALCTATVMFILSQDRLNMDLERSSLELMLQLLDSDIQRPVSQPTRTQEQERDLDRNRIKVRELCAEVQRKGFARHLSLDNISSGHLAMETLLSLTSRRAGEWFKEELRELGGLDHIVKTVSECVCCLGNDLNEFSQYSLDKLSKIDRCLRILENVTIMNTENQSYLIEYKQSLLISSLVRLLWLCIPAIPRYQISDKPDKDSPGFIIFNCILSILKVLLNLTHDNRCGSTKVGEQEGLIDIVLIGIVHIPRVITIEQIFDLLVLSLGLLINLVEYCDINRRKLIDTSVSDHLNWVEDNNSISSVEALIQLFMEKEEMARQEEARTDSLLEGKRVDDDQNSIGETGENCQSSSQNNPDDIEETLTKALQKAGKHMEDSMVAAYIALLVGCIIQDSQAYANQVREYLPDGNFDIMLQILKKFLNFMTLTSTAGNTGVKSIERVISILEAS